jgi:hypothetical protein
MVPALGPWQGAERVVAVPAAGAFLNADSRRLLEGEGVEAL